MRVAGNNSRYMHLGPERVRNFKKEKEESDVANGQQVIRSVALGSFRRGGGGGGLSRRSFALLGLDIFCIRNFTLELF